jgi:hypothetical protein
MMGDSNDGKKSRGQKDVVLKLDDCINRFYHGKNVPSFVQYFPASEICNPSMTFNIPSTLSVVEIFASYTFISVNT